MKDSPAVAGPSIRAQAKKGKNQQKQSGDGSGQTSKSIVKAVLANPLTVPWPSIPRHLQATILANLPSLIPTDIATYHTDRARCHQSEKRTKRSLRKEAENQIDSKGAKDKIGPLEETESGKGETSGNAKKRPAIANSAEQAKKRSKPSAHPPNEQTPAIRPDKPEMLPHLVFGINEVIKSLEAQTDALRLRVIMIGDALAEQQRDGKVRGGQERGVRELLPTAPPRVEDEVVADGDQDMEESEPKIPPTGPAGTEADPILLLSQPPLPITLPPIASPLEWIIIPLLSISPISLVSPIPAYCATYNTLVYQLTHISKIARTRLSSARAEELIGDAMQEVRVIPLGKVEEELAALAGLRRVACLSVRSSHPQIEILRQLLPKSILHPPRHSLTLPFPTSALTVTSAPQPTSAESAADSTKIAVPKSSNKTKVNALLPHVHYAPLHVKGITTSIPADGNAKKQKRMEEVRAKRRIAKERKKTERAAAK